jgi:threonine/homoserine/homoserine lactone efflux protein
MNLKLLMSIKSVICWVYGLAFLIIPVQILSIYGATISQDGEMTVRLFGASFILLAMWLGLERDTSEVSSMRAVAISVAVGDLLGCAIMVYYLLTGTGNILGWFNALLYLLLAIGFGYTLVTEPKGKLAI